MDKILIIVSAVVGSLGVLSAILGFSAEGTKLTPYDIIVFYDDCIYPQSPALGLGICAAIFLLASQVTFTAVGGCCGCCKSRSIPSPSETKRIVAIVCAVVSWIAAVIAWVLLIEGAEWNANVVRTMTAPVCYCLKDGIFAGAGVLSLAATALGLTSYVLMRTKRAKADAAPPVVPAEGEPKLPPPAPAATQGNGPPQKQELQRPPADTAPLPLPPAVMASAPPEPVVPTPPAGAEMDQPPVQLLQVGVPQPQPPVQLLQVLGVPVPQPQPPVQPNQQGSGHLVRDELTKAGIRLAARVVEHSLFSDNIGVGDLVVSLTDPLQSTEASSSI